jgi:hypothetical protein
MWIRKRASAQMNRHSGKIVKHHRDNHNHEDGSDDELVRPPERDDELRDEISEARQHGNNLLM